MGKISSVFLVDSNRPRGFCGVFFRVLVFFLTVVVVLLRLDVVVENGLSNIPLVIVPLQKTSFVSLFLCLSRACLGKCSILWYKLARKKAFPHRAVHQSMMPEHHVACMPEAVNGRGILVDLLQLLEVPAPGMKTNLPYTDLNTGASVLMGLIKSGA